jgi:valyl-tRNA synthetase
MMDREQIERQLERARVEITLVIRTLSNPTFLSRAPSDTIQAKVDRLADWKQRHLELEEKLRRLG